MNVALGDLARVIAPHVGAGAFVVVEDFLQLPPGMPLIIPQPTGGTTRYVSCGCPCWIVRGYVHHEKQGPVGPLCWVHDSMLKRVDPPAEGDESSRWVPPVPQEMDAGRVMRGLEPLIYQSPPIIPPLPKVKFRRPR